MSKVIGIDLGTTNSVVAVYEEGEPRIVANAISNHTTPSIVALTSEGQWLVGDAARNQQVTNPAHTIYSVKRFIGRRHAEVASEEKIVPYNVVGKPHDFVAIELNRRRYLPQHFAALLIRELKHVAETYLGEPVEGAVITVPAYFNDSQRQATKDAGEIAGLKVERIISEPTAAALAYGLEKHGSSKIIVFDFGGGTFDLSAMEIRRGSFRVLGVHGDTHLGGDDFDQRVIDIVADEFKRKELIDIREQPMALQRLKEAAEKAKVELSLRPQTEIMLPFITVDGRGPRHLEYTLTREMFESVCQDLFEGLQQTCKQLLFDLRLIAHDVDDVVLGGRSTRMPRVQDIAMETFRTKNLNKSINPDEVVALGAAVLGGVIQGDLQNVELMDVTSQTFGVETANGGVSKVVEKNTPIPLSVKREFSTPADSQTSVPIHVVEGESPRVTENRTLALFQLKGIRRAPRGVPKIEVEFAIDADGILNVSATDKDTGKTQKVVVSGGVGLEPTEIDRMREEAERHVEAKQDNADLVDLRHHAETVYNDLSKWLEFNGPMMTERIRSQIAGALSKLRKKIDRNDRAAIRALLKRLDEILTPQRRAG
ncbi:MAG: molecular chaperone DnaK [Planctomycetota bacterium]|jgi:molecular chaperone DnaK